jgi:hypothetical protein
MVNQLVERIRQKDQRAMSQLYQLYVEEQIPRTNHWLLLIFLIVP